jgi:hypothetical protein
MNAGRLKWCCSTAGFGASGSTWDEATEQKHNAAQIAKAKRRTRTKHGKGMQRKLKSMVGVIFQDQSTT